MKNVGKEVEQLQVSEQELLEQFQIEELEQRLEMMASWDSGSSTCGGESTTAQVNISICDCATINL